ncbi:hypothetical protein D3OALGA1CA_2939 [Olavius algarvensis associated proteobacterium Delta 3]|nr:hypothetical protein D3OALGB2SA_3258 [Olavius algarvensis associated proteobacterium Delta 3]CAB5126568.1 hypothetical protein D3OALGA1CA_2939 [Olavius algarvensis associated proteobacterium Delta 3]
MPEKAGIQKCTILKIWILLRSRLGGTQDDEPACGGLIESVEPRIKSGTTSVGA